MRFAQAATAIQRWLTGPHVEGNANWQLGGGDDNLDIVDSQIAQNVRVNLRAGNDFVNFDNSFGRLLINAGGGRDHLVLSGENAEGRLRGFETDSPSFQPGVQSFVAGDMILENQAGDVLIASPEADSANDNLRIFGTPNGGLRVFGVGGTLIDGRSNVDLGSVTFLTVFAGGGNDRVGLVSGSNSKHVNIHGQSGNDRVDIDDFIVGTELAILGNQGDDFVSTARVRVNKFIDVFTHEGNDQVNAFETSQIGFSDKHNIQMGSGTDLYWSKNGFGTHFVHMGSGDDRLAIDNHFGDLELIGSSGFDTISHEINGFGERTITSFEITDRGALVSSGTGPLGP